MHEGALAGVPMHQDMANPLGGGVSLSVTLSPTRNPDDWVVSYEEGRGTLTHYPDLLGRKARIHKCLTYLMLEQVSLYLYF